MARTMTVESIDAKIEKAEEKVVRTGEPYKVDCEELKKQRDKKAAIENEALVEAFMKSKKTLEEAIAFFESDPIDSSGDEKKPRGRGGRRKRASE